MPTVHAAPLPKPQRTQLENTVKAAREVAEKGARAALEQLAVGEGRAPDYLSDDHKALRRRLRAHGRALGDAKALDDTQAVQQLVWEVAYVHPGGRGRRMPPCLEAPSDEKGLSGKRQSRSWTRGNNNQSWRRLH